MTFEKYLDVLRILDEGKEIVVCPNTKNETTIDMHSDMEEAIKLLDNTNEKDIKVVDAQEKK